MTIGIVQQVGTDVANVPGPGLKHSSHTVTLPGSPTTGNLLVMVAQAGLDTIDILPPSGWTIRGTYRAQTGPNTPSMLVATKVVCPGDGTSVGPVTFANPDTSPADVRRSNVHVYEFNGGWGGITSFLRQGYGDTPIGDSATHTLPSITPTGGAEAYVMGHIVNENAYGKTGGPGGGYSDVLSTISNDGASDFLYGFGQHVASASGSYNPGTITYASSCVTTAVQFWVKAGFDSAPCLGPVCDFSGTPVSGQAPLTVHFEDESTGNPITAWDWDHGDGSGSTAGDHDHVYTDEGYFTVSLEVTNPEGTDSETKVAYIHVVGSYTNEVYEIIPPGDDIQFVGTLSDARDKAIRPVSNQPGTGSFRINRYSPEATAQVLKPGNLVRAIIPAIHPDAIFGWFMETGLDQLVSTAEEGGEDITIGGRGVLSYWDRAIWLSERFIIPWWDAGWGTPPAGARGHVQFAAGTYRRYTIAGGVITGYTNFTTGGFEAYFHERETKQWPAENSKRFLVKIMPGETNAGWYVHPHQDGVIETLPSQTVGTSSSVLLSDISPDTPGAILHHLYLEGTDPGRPVQPIPLMTIDFTATTDSNGDPWATTDALAGLTAELGDTYLDTIMQLVSTGVIDVWMGPDLDMHAWNSQGRDLTGDFGSGVVRFEKGINIADELEREREDNPVGTFVEVVGIDNAIGRAVLPDAASRVAREIAGTGDSADEAVLEALGLAQLEVRLAASDAIGLRVLAVGNDEAEGLYLPGPSWSDNGKYWMGDLITLHTGTGEKDFDAASQVVAAITITHNDAGELEVTPEVGSPLGEAERRLYALERRARATSFVERTQDDGQPSGETAHPDLATHDALGLATDAELGAHLSDTTDAHDASAVSIADAGAYFTGTDVEAALQELGAAGPGGGGGAILGQRAFTLGADASTSSSTPAIVDATGVTFVVPASGAVVVSFSGNFQGASGFNFYWCVMDGATNKGEFTVWSGGNATFPATVEILVTGLTPGATLTYKWGHRTNGGGTTKVLAYGTPNLMKVMAAA